MALFLASVTGPNEAEIALAHGADIIDLKDPGKGALGAVDAATVRASAAAVAGRRPVSAVTGDLPMIPQVIADVVGKMAQTGVDYVKVGLFPDPKREGCIHALSPLASRIKIVGVMFADRGADKALAPVMAECGFAGAMLDTALKHAGRLLDHMDITHLGDFVDAFRSCGLLSGLAGSLEAPDVPRLLLLAPDFLGFRGALCAGTDRAGPIHPRAVEVIRALIPAESRAEAHERP